MSEQERFIAYESVWTRFRRWTSLGVVAVTCSLTGLAFGITSLCVAFISRLGDLMPVWAFWIAPFALLFPSIFGGAAGVLAIITGTTDQRSRTDATLGMIAIVLSLIQATLLFGLLVFHRY